MSGALALLLATSGVAIAGCDRDEGGFEEAGEAADDAMDDAKDTMDDTMDEAEDRMD
jgi:hypothetical protein